MDYLTLKAVWEISQIMF